MPVNKNGYQQYVEKKEKKSWKKKKMLEFSFAFDLLQFFMCTILRETLMSTILLFA